MSLTFDSRTLTVRLERSPDEVYAYVSTVANLPQWATGLGTTVTEVDGQWIVETPAGPAVIRFADRNPFGVLDHTVTLPSGQVVAVPMWVIPNGAGSDLRSTVVHTPDVSATQFSADVAAVARDLDHLKCLLEQ